MIIINNSVIAEFRARLNACGTKDQIINLCSHIKKADNSIILPNYYVGLLKLCAFAVNEPQYKRSVCTSEFNAVTWPKDRSVFVTTKFHAFGRLDIHDDFIEVIDIYGSLSQNLLAEMSYVNVILDKYIDTRVFQSNDIEYIKEHLLKSF